MTKIVKIEEVKNQFSERLDEFYKIFGKNVSYT